MRLISLVIVACVGLMAIAACAPLPTDQQQQLSRQLTDTATALSQTATELHTIAAASPGTPLAKSTEKAATAVDKGVPVVAGAAAAATQPGASPLDIGVGAVTGALPFIPPPYQGYAALGLGLLAIWKTISKSKSDAVATSMQSGVQAALASGTLVASPRAAATIDALIVDHPTANAMVDAVVTAATLPNLPPGG